MRRDTHGLDEGVHRILLLHEARCLLVGEWIGAAHLVESVEHQVESRVIVDEPAGLRRKVSIRADSMKHARRHRGGDGLGGECLAERRRAYALRQYGDGVGMLVARVLQQR